PLTGCPSPEATWYATVYRPAGPGANGTVTRDPLNCGSPATADCSSGPVMVILVVSGLSRDRNVSRTCVGGLSRRAPSAGSLPVREWAAAAGAARSNTRSTAATAANHCPRWRLDPVITNASGEDTIQLQTDRLMISRPQFVASSQCCTSGATEPRSVRS